MSLTAPPSLISLCSNVAAVGYHPSRLCLDVQQSSPPPYSILAPPRCLSCMPSTLPTHTLHALHSLCPPDTVRHSETSKRKHLPAPTNHHPPPRVDRCSYSPNCHRICVATHLRRMEPVPAYTHTHKHTHTHPVTPRSDRSKPYL